MKYVILSFSSLTIFSCTYDYAVLQEKKNYQSPFSYENENGVLFSTIIFSIDDDNLKGKIIVKHFYSFDKRKKHYCSHIEFIFDNNMPTNGELIVKNIQLEHYTNTLLESKNQDGMYWNTRKEIEVGKGLFMVYRKNYFNPQLQDEMTEKIDIEFTYGEKTYSISKSYKIKKKYHYNAIESMMGI